MTGRFFSLDEGPIRDVERGVAARWALVARAEDWGVDTPESTQAFRTRQAVHRLSNVWHANHSAGSPTVSTLPNGGSFSARLPVRVHAQRASGNLEKETKMVLLEYQVLRRPGARPDFAWENQGR